MTLCLICHEDLDIFLLVPKPSNLFTSTRRGNLLTPVNPFYSQEKMADNVEDVNALLAIIYSIGSDSIDFKAAAEVSGVEGPPSLPPQKAM